jgi:hypothetical protein
MDASSKQVQCDYRTNPNIPNRVMAFRDFHRNLTIKLLIFFTHFCLVRKHVVPSHLVRDHCEAGGETGNDETRHARHHSYGLVLLPKLLVALYTFTNIKSLIYIYLQYNYDIECSKLYQLSQTSNPFLRTTTAAAAATAASTAKTGQVGPAKSREYFEQLARTNATRRLVKLIGAPHIELHLVSGGVGLILLVITFFSFAGFPLMERLRVQSAAHFYFPRAMLYEEIEMDYCRRLVGRKVRKFALSSKNFVLNWRERLTNVIGGLAAAGGRPLSPHLGRIMEEGHVCLRRLSEMAVLRKEASMHVHLCRHADTLLEGDRLMLYNRSTRRIDEMSLIFSTVSTSNLAFFACFDAGFFMGLPYWQGLIDISGPMDYWALVDIGILCLFAAIGFSFYAGLLSATCYDQNVYLINLRSRFKRCIEHNDQLFANYYANVRALRGPRGLADAKELSAQLNKNVIKVLLEYEIFLEQFAPTRDSLRTAISIMITSLMIVLAIIRLHMPYVSQELHQLVIYISPMLVLVCEPICVPVCQIYRSGTRLYRLISSLLAQSVEIDSRMELLTGQPVYSKFLVWYQRRLVDDFRRFSDNFAVHAYKRLFVMNWKNLVRTHYLFSLLIISFFIQPKTWKMIVGARVDDPLGLF